MKKYINHQLIVFLLLLSYSPASAQWSLVAKIITVISGIDAGLSVYDRLTEEEKDAKAMVFFTTDSPSDVFIYIQGNYMGKISRNQPLTLEATEGRITYVAQQYGGEKITDFFHTKKGVESRVFISTDRAINSFERKRKYGKVSGKNINFRRDTFLTPQTIIRKISYPEQVQILAKVFVAGNSKDQIVSNPTSFYDEKGNFSFKVEKGYAVKLTGYSSTNGYPQIRLPMRDGTYRIGYISRNDLRKMENMIWYKVLIGNDIGWVYGDYIKEY